MKKMLKSHQGRLLLVAVAISLFAGALTISRGSYEHVYHFGFPGTFLTLHRPISEFPAGLEIQPIQFAANVGVIWLILFYFSKAFRRVARSARIQKDAR